MKAAGTILAIDTDEWEVSHSFDNLKLNKCEDIIVKDLNGDGLITDEDKIILGNPYPDVVYSFTNEFKFGAFDFSFMVQGSLGGQVNNIGDQYFYNWFGSATGY